MKRGEKKRGRIYAVSVECAVKGCRHIVALGNTEVGAWGAVDRARYGIGLVAGDDARTERFSWNNPVVRQAMRNPNVGVTRE